MGTDILAVCRHSVGKIQLEDAKALLRLLKCPPPQLPAAEVQACSLVLLARFVTAELRAPLSEQQNLHQRAWLYCGV